MNHNKIGKSFRIILLSLGILSLSPSCTNLNEELYSQLGKDNFLKSDAEVVSAIGAAYSSVRFFNNFGNAFTLYETSNEASIPGRTGGDWLGDGLHVRLIQHTWDADDGNFEEVWTGYFTGVNDCNRVIYQLEQVDAEKYKTYIAEMKVLRALWYLWLIDEWGNVPIVDKYDVPADYRPKTNTRQEVYNFIEKEVKDNMNDLSKENNTSTYARVTYWTAQAILAKLYLNAQVYTGTPQWQKALDACDEIIDSKKFVFMDNNRANFISRNENSTEAIFAITYDAVYTEGKFFLPLISLHYSSQQTFNMTNQPWNGMAVETDFFNLYEDGDVRKSDYFLFGPQYTSTGEPLLDMGYEKDLSLDPNGAPIDFTPTFTGTVSATARQCGARIKKWEIEMGSSGHLSSDFFVFRYTDILLMKAELLWRLNPLNTEALDLVNQIRTRAKVLPFGSLTADRILDERGRELFLEGWRRSDLIRFDQYNDPTIWRPLRSESFRKLYPVCIKQLNANTNLTQNPGYN